MAPIIWLLAGGAGTIVGIKVLADLGTAFMRATNWCGYNSSYEAAKTAEQQLEALRPEVEDRWVAQKAAAHARQDARKNK